MIKTNHEVHINNNNNDYGCWGPEAQTNLSRLAARFVIRSNCCKSQATLALYGRLNLVLVRANARALLSRSMATGC